MHKQLLLALLFCAAIATQANAQLRKGLFRLQSTANTADKNYGVIELDAGQHTVVISTIMANGENVKGLTIQLNNGFPFKLAPSQSGSILNYVGADLKIVLEPGDKARVEFIVNPKTTGNRQLYLSGEVKD